jgi:hypothetical protein
MSMKYLRFVIITCSIILILVVVFNLFKTKNSDLSDCALDFTQSIIQPTTLVKGEVIYISDGKYSYKDYDLITKKSHCYKTSNIILSLVDYQNNIGYISFESKLDDLLYSGSNKIRVIVKDKIIDLQSFQQSDTGLSGLSRKRNGKLVDINNEGKYVAISLPIEPDYTTSNPNTQNGGFSIWNLENKTRIFFQNNKEYDLVRILDEKVMTIKDDFLSIYDINTMKWVIENKKIDQNIDYLNPKIIKNNIYFNSENDKYHLDINTGILNLLSNETLPLNLFDKNIISLFERDGILYSIQEIISEVSIKKYDPISKSWVDK